MRKTPIIQEVCREIAETFQPEKIILFSCKYSLDDEVTSFKLVVIADRPNLEREIYLAVDSEIPFDVVAYSPEDWAELREIPHSFARRVDEKGMVLYG